MANETENTGQDTDNTNNNNQGNAGNANASDSGIDPNVDPAISRHLDIAIEAQDGKTDATTKAKEVETDEAGKGQQSESGKSSASDSGTQSGEKEAGKGKEGDVSEAGRTLARARDLKLTDGTIVKGGAERRFYEQREAARQELSAVQRDYNDLQNKFKDLETKHSSLEESTRSLHGVDAKVLSAGAKIVTDIQRDPVGTLKKLVAEAAAQGYNVEDLGVGIDTAAIARMIDERIPKETAREKTDVELEAEATKEVNAFYSQYPDAKPHDTLLAAVLRDHPDLNLRSAYFQLKTAFAEKGFDWSLPLEENLKNEQSNSANNQENNQQQGNSDNKKPLPSGGNGAGAEFKLNDSSQPADDMDTSEIVKQAMRESGMNI